MKRRIVAMSVGGGTVLAAAIAIAGQVVGGPVVSRGDGSGLAHMRAGEGAITVASSPGVASVRATCKAAAVRVDVRLDSASSTSSVVIDAGPGLRTSKTLNPGQMVSLHLPVTPSGRIARFAIMNFAQSGEVLAGGWIAVSRSAGLSFYRCDVGAAFEVHPLSRV